MRKTWLWAIVALAAAGGLVFVSPWASSSPDGLEKVAADHGKAAPDAAPPAAPMSDYKVAGVRHEGWSTVLAGLAGVAAVFVAALGLGRLIRSRGGRAPAEGPCGGTPASR